MLFTPRPKSLGADNFLKLTDRESVNVYFRGDVHTFRRHWVGGRSQDCTGAQSCGVCKTDPENRATFRFRVNVITDELTPKIFEGGGDTYDALNALNGKHDLSDLFVKIKRFGLKTNTNYDFEAIEKAIPAKLKTQIEEIPLLALS